MEDVRSIYKEVKTVYLLFRPSLVTKSLHIQVMNTQHTVVVMCKRVIVCLFYRSCLCIRSFMPM